MAKELSAIVKLQIKGGAANPSPPIGPALGAKGINIMEFCKQFNAKTQKEALKRVKESGIKKKFYQVVEVIENEENV